MKFDTLVVYVKFHSFENSEKKLPDEHPVYGKLSDVTLIDFDFDHMEENEDANLAKYILDFILFTGCKKVIIISSNGLCVCDHLLAYPTLEVHHYELSKDNLNKITITKSPFNLVSVSLVSEVNITDLHENFGLLERYFKWTNCIDYLNKVHRFTRIVQEDTTVHVSGLLTNKIYVYVNPKIDIDIEAVEKIKGHPLIEIVHVESFEEVLKIDDERKLKATDTA